MNRKLCVCLILFFGLNNFALTYDYPCHPPFLGSCRLFSFENSPGLLSLSQKNAAFVLEIAAGEYSSIHLFPWPRIQGYWRFKYKHLGFSLSLIDRYQFTFREELDAIDPQGQYVGKYYFWESHFIYTLRTGLSYQFLSHFIFGVGGDINHGIQRFDTEWPSDATNEYHIKYVGYSSSYCIGMAILSHRRKPMLSIGYDSKVRIALKESAGYLRYHYFIPQQLSASLSFLMGEMDLIINYYRRSGKYQDYYDTLRAIVTNDFAISFLRPIGTNTKFCLAFYSLPLSYNVSSKGFGFSFGPKLMNKGFLNEFLVIYEMGNVSSLEIPWEWRLTRYGIRLGFAL